MAYEEGINIVLVALVLLQRPRRWRQREGNEVQDLSRGCRHVRINLHTFMLLDSHAPREIVLTSSSAPLSTPNHPNNTPRGSLSLD